MLDNCTGPRTQTSEDTGEMAPNPEYPTTLELPAKLGRSVSLGNQVQNKGRRGAGEGEDNKKEVQS